MPAPRCNAVGLVVDDLARAMAFYGLLGAAFDAPADAPHAEADLGGGFRLLLDPVSTVLGFDPGWRRGHGGATLAFECEAPAAVDATAAALVAAGGTLRLAPWDAPWGQRYASLDDPDGHPLDLYAPLAEG